MLYACFLPCFAADWPQFKRDAARTGDAADEAVELPLRLAWQARFESAIYASPAVAGGLVYIQDARGTLACLDAATGTVAWRCELGGINNSSSPAVAAGRVFAGNTAGDLAIVDAASGELIRRVALGAPVLAAPAVVDNAVYVVTIAGRLVRLDMTGKTVWSYDDAKGACRTELAVSEGQVVFATDAGIHWVDVAGPGASTARLRDGACPSSGPLPLPGGGVAYQTWLAEFGAFKVAWRGDRGRVEKIANMGDARAVPSRRDDRVYTGQMCLQVEADRSVTRIWQVDPDHLYDGGYHSSPALSAALQIIGSEAGRLLAFPLDGEARKRGPVWSWTVPGAEGRRRPISSSPAVADGGVFVGGEDGGLYAFAASGDGRTVTIPAAEEGEVVRPRSADGSEWITPGGDMGYSHVFAGDDIAPPLRIRWQTRVFGVFKHNAVVADGKVFMAGRMGSLTALDAATGEIRWRAHHPGVESRSGPAWHDGSLLVYRTRLNHPDTHEVRNRSPGGPPTGQGLWCHEAATGALRWHRPLPRLGYLFNADGPVAADGLAFVCEAAEDGAVAAVAVSCDDGREVWRTPLPGICCVRGWEGGGKSLFVPRFASALADGVWAVSMRGPRKKPGSTFGIETASGRIRWHKKDLGIGLRSRIASRRGVLVVFAPDRRAHALRHGTGEPLWVSDQVGHTGTYYQQALSDAFLDSHGREGLVGASGCALPVFANGLYYTHLGRWKGGVLTAKRPHPKGRTKVVWKWNFGANACPSPGFAYGRMYYAANGEGMVYCFEPEEREAR